MRDNFFVPRNQPTKPMSLICDFIFILFFLHVFQTGKIGNPWAPVVDGPFVGVNYAFLPDPPADLRRQLRQLKIPLLAGMVLNEGAYFIRTFHYGNSYQYV